MRRFFRSIAAVGLVVFVSACGANHHSIYRHTKVTEDSQTITLVDAKQRAILTGVYKRAAAKNGETKTVRRFCSEPSPDVFSVIAQSLSVAGAFGQSADPKAIEASLNAAFSSAETGSTIPRTQTINMLRELMFNTCLRYLSDGIDSVELSVQAVRDQRLMVSILAIEQLTGAVTPKPVIIGAGGSGTSGAGSNAIVKLDEARNDKVAADKAAIGAKEEYDNLNTVEGHCDAVNKAVADGKEEELSDKPAEKKEGCKKAQAKVDKANKGQSDASTHYADLKRLAASSGVSVDTAFLAQSEGGLNSARDQSVAEVANTVQNIVGYNFDDNTELMLFCLRAMKEIEDYDVKPDQKAQIIAQCVGFLNADIEAAKIKRRLDTKKFSAALEEIGSARTTNFDKFWSKISDTDQSSGFSLDRLNKLVSGRFGTSLPRSMAAAFDKMRAANSKVEMKIGFNKLSLNEQKMLIN